MISTVPPFFSIIPCRQATVQRVMSPLMEAHLSHGRRQVCSPCFLPTAALAASKEPHCACHERSSTTADARPTLCRHEPRLIAPLLFPTNNGAALTPPLSSFSSNTLMGYKARCHTPCHANVNPVVATHAIPSHAASFTRQCRKRPHPPPPPSRHGSLTTRMSCRDPL